MCRHADAQNYQGQSVSCPSQNVLSGTLSQYAVFTSGQQQFLSPVILLPSDGSNAVPSAAVQLVTVAPSDVNFTDGVDMNHTHSSISVKQESTSESRQSNCDAVLDDENKDEASNGVSESDSADDDQVSEADDAQSERCSSVPVVDNENIVLVSPLPISRPTDSTRRSRSMSSVPHSSDPALRALKRSTARHMSSDQPASNKTATENDSLPLSVSSMTDDADD